MSDPSHPNVVFILADNVGWGDIGCHGGLAPTPRLDALAGQGTALQELQRREPVLAGVLKVTQQPLIDLHDSMAAAAGHAQRE